MRQIENENKQSGIVIMKKIKKIQKKVDTLYIVL